MSEAADATGHWLVSGEVQGVGFRWFVLREARRLRLTGWVRNLPDGRVEALACGAPERLGELQESLRRGPPAARVQHVERTDIPHEIAPSKSFEIR